MVSSEKSDENDQVDNFFYRRLGDVGMSNSIVIIIMKKFTIRFICIFGYSGITIVRIWSLKFWDTWGPKSHNRNTWRPISHN